MTRLIELSGEFFKAFMYNIDWNIQFKTDGKDYQLAILGECDIFSSVDNLADTATIVLPETVMNVPLNFENRIRRGSEVIIDLGYDGNIEREFTGYIQEITQNDSSLKIICEDALFLMRVGIPDVELKPTNLKGIAQYIVDNIEEALTVDCTYNISYEKFVIHQATGYDVLKKIQDETEANIYFDTEKKTLNIHPPYVVKGGEVFYSMQKNVEASSLEFKNRLDTKVEVTIESTDIKGNVRKVVKGTTGGDKVTIKVGPISEESINELAEVALRRRSAPGYTGTFDTWLIPYVKPTYSARIKDEYYPDKTGYYYVQTVNTNLSEGGGKRTITPGIRLS